MKPAPAFFTSPAGHLVLILAVLALGGGAVVLQRFRRQPAPLPAAAPVAPAAGPQTFTRSGVRLKLPDPVAKAVGHATPGGLVRTEAAAPLAPVPAVLPLSLLALVRTEPAVRATGPAAPYGRLIPCETVVTIESNRLDTPVIGLVTEDVWAEGRIVIPVGAEVHGKASPDRARERLAVTGQWVIVWRAGEGHGGGELAVQGIALDREVDPKTGAWGMRDGSAGLRGEVMRSGDDRELKLFASTFLATATAALQGTRAGAGVFGEVAVPAATVRNATLAGTGAILREYADGLRAAIARDGFHVRVPAGKPFYLYVTQSLDADQARRGGQQPTSTHEN